MPPTPSWWWGTWSIIFGMKPPTSVPVVSVMYLPTVPLAFARPFGNRDDVELSSRRAVSRALAARTTTFACTRWSVPAARIHEHLARHRVREEGELPRGEGGRDQHVRGRKVRVDPTAAVALAAVVARRPSVQR